ncbi:MAG: ABC transporter ATP-binding protein [Kutzneria sp.]|nr:ABC transporter ATP-binding protein [Kutzneria sp.]
MAAITTTGLGKVYPGGVRALDALDLSITDGEFFALLGPSGCGKTTLLRTLAGLESPTSGSITIGTSDVTRLPPGRRDVAMVFQDYALFPHMTTADNIAYPLRVNGVPKSSRHDKAAQIAAELGLAELLARRPGQLSGGQQQRAALARAMACHPKAFLFDEPLSNLDARMRLEARSFLKRLQRQLGVTTVFVTHDQSEALAMADRIAVMESGHIRQIGTPVEVFRRPSNIFVASFIGSTPMNLLEAMVVDGQVETCGQRLVVPNGVIAGLANGVSFVLGLRPEYLTLHTASVPGALCGVVAVVENLGSQQLVSLEVSGTTVRCVVTEDAEPALGAECWLVPRAERVLVYLDGELVEDAVLSDAR